MQRTIYCITSDGCQSTQTRVVRLLTPKTSGCRVSVAANSSPCPAKNKSLLFPLLTEFERRGAVARRRRRQFVDHVDGTDAVKARRRTKGRIEGSPRQWRKKLRKEAEEESGRRGEKGNPGGGVWWQLPGSPAGEPRAHRGTFGRAVTRVVYRCSSALAEGHSAMGGPSSHKHTHARAGAQSAALAVIKGINKSIRSIVPSIRRRHR
ncbi:hypothetical protein MRX96_042048 [Rhipicephalus microplus]